MRFFLLIIGISIYSFADFRKEDLSLEEKIGQILLVHFNGEVATEEARELIQDLHVGGVIYYNWANRLDSPSQVKELSNGLQEYVKQTKHQIPLFIAVDQEGGRVCRLRNGFSFIPSSQVIATTYNDDEAYRLGKLIAKELIQVGINMNLAPVVDVNSNPKNIVIGDRAYSNDPLCVEHFANIFVKAFQEEGLIGTLKHYPGYGEVVVDPHEDLPMNCKSLDELEQVELFPYKKLATSCDVIMTAHILVPAFDPKKCATLSKQAISYLRHSIGFDGVVMADSLIMEGVVNQCGSVDQVVIEALNAGCDILMLGGKLLNGEKKGFELNLEDIKRIQRRLIDAIESGEVSIERLDAAVEKVLRLKNRYEKKD
jgi:beta-N-acetylhexosaminidase